MTGNEPSGGLRVAADIGGTFTDIAVILESGRLLTRKVPSTPHDYSEAVVLGIGALLDDAGLGAADTVEVLHGCTVATNAILEGKGARTALVTTAGFRDVLEMRRIRVPRLYEPLFAKPAPLVPRHRRLEVIERMGPDGAVLQPVDLASLDAVIERLRQQAVEAIAVCFLHSYANPAHEIEVGARLRAAFPDAFVSLSVEILPEIREYERTSTTVINALVGPPVKRYLASLIARLAAAGLPRRLLMMQSSGGVLDARTVMQQPAQIVECGPAAGVIGAARFGARAGMPNLITFDMGGTTAKASLIEGGRLQRTDEYEVGGGISLSSRLAKGGGYALKLPVLDISEVGAGGGSVVWLDKAGALKVGPHSAGAVPGPACYAAGGIDATVTDANVVLGYLNPTALAGGTVPIDADLAWRTIETQVAQPLGLGVVEAAYGIHQVATTLMTRALKAISTQRGRDPRAFSLFAFGGNGGVHGATLARGLRMARVVLPPGAGVFSALGLLHADIELSRSHAFLRRVDATTGDALEDAFTRLEHAVARDLDIDRAQLRFRRAADLRATGQAFELSVPVPPGLPDPIGIAASFDREQERTYGHAGDAARSGEFVTLRVTGALPPADRPAMRYSPGAAGMAGARRAYFGPDKGWIETQVVGRAGIGRTPVAGPLIIEEYEGTSVVPPDASVYGDEFGNLVIDLREA